jgi:hypothetical protein
LRQMRKDSFMTFSQPTNQPTNQPGKKPIQ